MQHKLGGMFFQSGTINLRQRKLIWLGTSDLANQDQPSEAERAITHGTMLPLSPIFIFPNVPFGGLFDGS